MKKLYAFAAGAVAVFAVCCLMLTFSAWFIGKGYDGLAFLVLVHTALFAYKAGDAVHGLVEEKTK
mgnify:CR=1 FL=1